MRFTLTDTVIINTLLQDALGSLKPIRLLLIIILTGSFLLSLFTKQAPAHQSFLTRGAYVPVSGPRL